MKWCDFFGHKYGKPGPRGMTEAVLHVPGGKVHWSISVEEETCERCGQRHFINEHVEGIASLSIDAVKPAKTAANVVRMKP